MFEKNFHLISVACQAQTGESVAEQRVKVEIHIFPSNFNLFGDVAAIHLVNPGQNFAADV